MTDLSAALDAAAAASKPPKAAPLYVAPDTVLAMTNYGREVYLLDCGVCGASVAVRRRDLMAGVWPERLTRHQNWHAAIGSPIDRDAWGLTS